VLTTTSLLEGVGIEESHDVCLLCVDLYTISNTPFLADMSHHDGLQLARASGHEREVINIQ